VTSAVMDSMSSRMTTIEWSANVSKAAVTSQFINKTRKAI